MKTTNGIPCNDYFHTPKALHSRIVYRFVSDDTNTPSSCTIRLGDTDPLTGETITDVGFFTEYYRLAEHQVYENLKAVRADMTAEEKRLYNEEKAAYAKTFEKKYGYSPRKSDLRNALAERWSKKYHISIQEMVSDDGDDKSDRQTGLSIPADDPFGTDLPDDITCLREVAASLTGRLADVYEALIIKYAGGKEKISFSSIAEKWGVSCTQIGHDRDRIFRMIRNAVAKARAEE